MNRLRQVSALFFFAACTALILVGLLATLQIVAPKIVDIAAASPPELAGAIVLGALFAFVIKTLLD